MKHGDLKIKKYRNCPFYLLVTGAQDIATSFDLQEYMVYKGVQENTRHVLLSRLVIGQEAVVLLSHLRVDILSLPS